MRRTGGGTGQAFRVCGGLGDYGAAVGDVCADHSSCTDFYAVAHADISHQDGPRADQASVPDLGRFAADLTNGHILINPAAAPELGIA